MLRTKYWVLTFLLFLAAQSVFAQTQVWVPVNPPPNRTINSIEAIGTSLYALTDSGVFLTKDGGTNWETVTGFYGNLIYQLFKCDTTLFVVTRRQQSISDTANILNRSTNGGVSWDSTHVGPGYFTGATNGLYYNDHSDGLFYESLDQKTHIWIDSTISKTNKESFLKASEHNYIICALDSEIGTTFTYVKWRVSADLGKTWRDFSPPQYNVGIDGDTFLASAPNGVFRSIDTCRTWQLINSSLNSGGRFTKKNNIIYLQNVQKIVYSLDHGYTWKQLSDGLPRFNIFGFTVGDDKLYIMFEREGVYRTSVPSAVKSEKPIEANLSIFPNPLTSEGNITYSLPTHSAISIIIYDALGRAVATPISDQPQDAGEHTISFDAKNLNPGVYACHLSTGGYESVVKFIVVR
jgi:hypothetical protein